MTKAQARRLAYKLAYNAMVDMAPTHPSEATDSPEDAALVTTQYDAIVAKLKAKSF